VRGNAFIGKLDLRNRGKWPSSKKLEEMHRNMRNGDQRKRETWKGGAQK
jgi:hypothetical protein